jgi:hypothetical protein
MAVHPFYSEAAELPCVLMRRDNALSLEQLRNRNLDKAAGHCPVNRADYVSSNISNARPACRPDHYYSDPALTQILLVSQILVRRDQYLETGGIGFG